MRIRDKVFVVTGGGNGIGQQVVWGLLTRGARVAAVDVSEAGLAQTASRALSVDRLSTHVVNVTDVAAVNALPEAVVAAHGAAHGLLNVAGIIQRFVKFGDLEPADIERVMNVNVYGVVNLCRAFLPLLVARPQAALVNVSSMGGFVPVPGQTIYGAPKAAVKLLTEGLRAELHGTNVAVSVVFPGAVGDQHHGQQRRGDSRDGRCGGAGAQDHPARGGGGDHRPRRREGDVPRLHRQRRPLAGLAQPPRSRARADPDRPADGAPAEGPLIRLAARGPGGLVTGSGA